MVLKATASTSTRRSFWTVYVYGADLRMHIWEGPGVSGGARIDTLVGVYRGQPLFYKV